MPTYLHSRCHADDQRAIEQVVDDTFGAFVSQPERLANCQIIGFTHDVVNDYNTLLFTRCARAMNARVTIHHAANVRDKCAGDVATAMATDEYLASVDMPGLPPSDLKLFPGAIVALHRNIDTSRHLTNGAKLLVVEVSTFRLTVKVVATGLICDLPRMKLPAAAANGIEFSRTQFPVRHAYAITANRAQGQTFDGPVVVDCRSPSFSHGQLYVALSRVRDVSCLQVVGLERTPDGYFTRSVVFQPLLEASHDRFHASFRADVGGHAV